MQPAAAYCSPVPASASPLSPSFDKLDHLLKAADHLYAAGLREDAARIRQQAEKDMAALKKESDSLKAEVVRLHQSAVNSRQVMLHIKVLELQTCKLRRLGFDVAKVAGPNDLTLGASNPFACTLVGDNKAFLRTLDAMRHDNLLSIVAEPTLVTVNGHMANFQSGPGIPSSVERHAEVATSGTEINVVPTILLDGRLRIQLHAKFSELDLQQTVRVQNVTIPGVRCRQFTTARRSATRPNVRRQGTCSASGNRKAGNTCRANGQERRQVRFHENCPGRDRVVRADHARDRRANGRVGRPGQVILHSRATTDGHRSIWADAHCENSIRIST